MSANLTLLNLEAAFRTALARHEAPKSLAEVARRLGVTREHLSRVLHGHRQSASLTRRFRALEQSMRKTKASA